LIEKNDVHLHVNKTFNNFKVNQQINENVILMKNLRFIDM